MRHETPSEKAKRINEERRKRREATVSTYSANDSYKSTIQTATAIAVHSSFSSWDSGSSSSCSGGGSDW